MNSANRDMEEGIVGREDIEVRLVVFSRCGCFFCWEHILTRTDDEGGGDRYRHQRRRYEEPIAAIVRRQLLNVAEPVS